MFFFLETRTRGWLKIMVEELDKGCLTEKQGLHQVTEILENYGIDSETDGSVLDSRVDTGFLCRLIERR
jgi:hypothetical protein